MVRYIIDTGVFYNPYALEQIAATRLDIIVPVTVYMERVRQLRRNRLDPRRFIRYLKANEFDVEDFSRHHAERFAVRIHDDKIWRRLYRDAMIAGHVGKDDVLWTTNPKDFRAVGLEADQVAGV